jgi:hypothetical protein
MAKTKSVDRLQQRFQQLAGRLAKTRWVLQGTISQREIHRPQGNSAQRKLYGPYYQWTFKRDGKTITVQLSAEQAAEYQRAIDQQREVETILDQMRRLSENFLTATTEGVPKRNRPPKRSTSLS